MSEAATVLNLMEMNLIVSEESLAWNTDTDTDTQTDTEAHTHTLTHTEVSTCGS